MVKIALIDVVASYTEPYPRPYVLGLVANVCMNIPFMRNASMTTIMGYGFSNGRWESHKKAMNYVAFEIDRLTRTMENLAAGSGLLGSMRTQSLASWYRDNHYSRESI